MSLLTRPMRRAGSAGEEGEHVAPAAAPAPDPAPVARDTGARLRLPHGLASWRFAVIVGGILAAGLVALLTVNTSLAAGSITLRGLESDLARATERQQALQTTVESLSSPLSLEQAARELGLVPSSSPVFLDPATGRLSGALEPAPAAAEEPVPAPQVAAPEPPPAEAPEPDAAANPSANPSDLPYPLPAPSQTPAPTPSTTPSASAEPLGDGARLPGSQPTPAPTPSPPPPRGDGAAILPGGED
jgi:hypothetical protein